jgi:UDP-3-O-acyl-N-acetylglucosamine deacetylase
MWLFTNTGFVSAVSDGKDLMVRARDKQSLEPIAESAKANIIPTPKNDYPYRVIVTHEFFAQWVAHMAINIGYKNFKSEVASTRGHGFAHPLMDVWSAMHKVEDQWARNC